MGIWRLGAVHVPLFTAFAPAGIALRLTGSRAKVVVCDAEQQDKLAPGEDMPAEAPWAIITTGTELVRRQARPATSFHELTSAQPAGFRPAALGEAAPIIQIFTSGTTGRPKSVVVPSSALAMIHAYMELAVGVMPEDVLWCAADPGWAYGLYFGILGCFTTGVQGILLKAGFAADLVYKVLERYAVTNFTAAPTVYRSLRLADISAPHGLKVKRASSAGEPLTPEVNEWAIDALGVTVYDHYGQTETGMLINNHHHPALLRPLKEGCMGRSMPGWHAVILENDEDRLAPTNTFGRIAMDLSKSPLAWFEGYAEDPERSVAKFTADRRFYITGDIGRTDEDGNFYFSSRDDDVIIMAGYRIGPFDVESALITHAAVSECAVVAVPDPVRGEVLVTALVLRTGFSPSNQLTAQLQDWVKKRYAAHAYPRRVHYVPSLPKTASGKLQRFILRQQLRDGQLREVIPAADASGDVNKQNGPKQSI
jgi:acetyl-CoA synthetase